MEKRGQTPDTEHTSVYLNKFTVSAIKKAGLLKDYSKSQLINWSLVYFIPEIFKQKDIKNSVAKRYINLAKRQNKRQLLLKLKKEENSKIYFQKRFIKELKQLLQNKFKKTDILRLVDIYIEISQTYANNETVTKQLKKIYKHIETTKTSTELIGEFLNVQILNKESKQFNPNVKVKK